MCPAGFAEKIKEIVRPMWTLDELRRWGGGDVIGKNSVSSVSGFSIDTRTLSPGALFIALKGPQYDGHTFVREAIRKGAIGAMVSRDWFQSAGGTETVSDFPTAFFIAVDDPLVGLQSLARWRRSGFAGPLVGITGSNGKTTTKEMLARILERRGPVLKSEGNFNNAIGLPLSLLRLSNADQRVVLEMGISQPGEMRVLTEIAKPTVGVITNIGASHLEFLGTLSGVAAEKQVLFEAIPSEGAVVINRDDPHLASWKGSVQQWTYAIDRDADLMATDIQSDAQGTTFTLQLHRGHGGGGKQRIILSLFGWHHVYNAMAASAAALSLGYEFDDIREGLRQVRPISLRGEMIEVCGATIFLDAYNANPGSVKGALQTLASLAPSGSVLPWPGRKVALLGDMLELGEASESAHQEVGRMAAQYRIDRLIAIGKFSSWVARGAEKDGMKKESISAYEKLDQVDLAREIRSGDLVLIKGSRGMKMERLLDRFSPQHGVAHAV
jgi:UDP-N-acetylmuramoyl-tripeptide--D-alanyl-D-alanine ligase